MNLNLPKLVHLQLGGNQLTVLPPFPPTLPSLWLLFIYAPLSEINKGTFVNLGGLEQLIIPSDEGSTIAKLEEGDFIFSTEKLDLLVLNGLKNVAEFEPHFFTAPNYATHVYIDNGSIETLEEEVFRELFENMVQDGGLLYIMDNPLLCDCSLAWLVKEPELMNVLLQEAEETACADGTLLSDLNPEDFDANCP